MHPIVTRYESASVALKDPLAPRFGTFLYHLGSIVALLGFVVAGWIVAHPADGAGFRIWIYCGAAIAAWLLGRVALYMLARR